MVPKLALEALYAGTHIGNGTVQILHVDLNSVCLYAGQGHCPIVDEAICLRCGYFGGQLTTISLGAVRPGCVLCYAGL